MGVREGLNRRPWLTAAVLAPLTIVVCVAGLRALRPSEPAGRQFYTADDGKTWYVDRGGLPVPFIKDGKEVVMAEVFEAKGRRFVAYMRRYTPDSLKALASKDVAGDRPAAGKSPGTGGMPLRMEYKKPGDTRWHDIDGDVKAMSEYLNLTSPEGELVQVEP